MCGLLLQTICNKFGYLCYSKVFGRKFCLGKYLIGCAKQPILERHSFSLALTGCTLKSENKEVRFSGSAKTVATVSNNAY